METTRGDEAIKEKKPTYNSSVEVHSCAVETLILNLLIADFFIEVTWCQL